LGILENPAIPSTLLNWNIQLMFQAEMSGPYVHNLVLYPTLQLSGCVRLGLLDQKIHLTGRASPIAAEAFVNEIKECLNTGRYVYLYADYFYLPGTTQYSKTHFRHELLVYGYEANACFKGALYTKEGLMASIDVPFGQLVEAISSPHARGMECAEYCRGDLLMSLAPAPVIDYVDGFDFEGIKAQIESYLSSSFVFKFKCAAEDSSASEYSFGSQSPDRRRFFGRSIYPEMKNYFNQHINSGKLRYDLRVTRLLAEHKRLMGIRLRRLIGAGHKNLAAISRQWPEVELLAEALHIRAVAARTRKDPAILANIGDELQKLDSLELELLTRVLGAKTGRRKMNIKHS